MNKHAFQFIAILLLVTHLSSCAFMKLKEDIKVLESNIGIGGDIKNRSLQQKPLIVILYEEVDGERQIVGIKILEKTDQLYFFLVPIGEYYILAFEDANANLSYDTGEYFGAFGQPDKIRITSLKPRDDLNIDVSRTRGFPEGFSTDVSKMSIASSIKTVAVGAITTLDNEKFSQEMASKGFWQPVTFLKEAGIGIYFLEAYDPKKIPILFVHGAAGTPRHFQYLAEHIDRTRYQPWFYHYPSGIPLEKISLFLNEAVTVLHDEYHFNRLFVTAHSMGGLVSRSFILKNAFEDGNDYIELFVSISTPWGGLETAQKGVESAPAAIPSWYDVVPNSPFIQGVFSKTLKARIDYYLIFSYKGDCSLFMDNNDGSVTLRAQLDLRAQKDALSKWGFDQGHVDILSSPEVVKTYTEILDKTGSRNKPGLRLFGVKN
jgi:triacylglycerol esterase/lipase EstA (alpha/beta hydrolase family)